MGRTEMLGLGHAEIGLAVANLRQHLARDGEAIDQPLVPSSRADVEQHGAGGVARIDGVHACRR